MAAAVAGPQLPPVAEPHQPQARRLAERAPHRRQGPRLVERAPHRPQPELRQLPEVEAEGVVVAISPATPTLMAPSTPDSARWLATQTACRR